MRRRPPALAAVLVAAGLALGACAGTDDGTPGGTPAPGTGFPVTVGEVTLDERPDRIVVLSPTATEMLFAIGAGGQVVAVDDNSNHPPEAPTTELSAFQPNAEAVAGYEPDLVVLSDDMDGIIERLRALQIPVYHAPAATRLEDSYRQIAELGQLTGRDDAADDLVRQMRDDIDKLVADVPAREEPLRYYYELDPTLYTVTSRTFIGHLFTMAGMQNVADAAADGTDYPQLSPEVLVDADPDVIFLADTKCCGASAETVAARDGWDTITAVRTGRIVELDDDIASRWGPRVVDLVRAITDAAA